jgi:serine/threonine-protein kinase
MKYKSFKLFMFLSFFVFAVTASISFAAEKGNPMVTIKGGKFKAGAKGKSVSVKAFKIDKYEVSFDQYAKIDNTMEVPEGKGNHPVTEVSYEDADKYCKAVGKRLPTAIEFEKAARGEDGRKFSWGNEFDANLGNTSETEINETIEITGNKAGASPYGVFNMTGNVSEWVNDWASKEKKYRVLMGCSYFDTPEQCFLYSHSKSIPDDIHPYNGFRCAK